MWDMGDSNPQRKVVKQIFLIEAQGVQEAVVAVTTASSWASAMAFVSPPRAFQTQPEYRIMRPG
jgi:hypothetical protein